MVDEHEVVAQRHRPAGIVERDRPRPSRVSIDVSHVVRLSVIVDDVAWVEVGVWIVSSEPSVLVAVESVAGATTDESSDSFRQIRVGGGRWGSGSDDHLADGLAIDEEAQRLAGRSRG